MSRAMYGDWRAQAGTVPSLHTCCVDDSMERLRISGQRQERGSQHQAERATSPPDWVRDAVIRTPTATASFATTVQRTTSVRRKERSRNLFGRTRVPCTFIHIAALPHLSFAIQRSNQIPSALESTAYGHSFYNSDKRFERTINDARKSLQTPSLLVILLTSWTLQVVSCRSRLQEPKTILRVSKWTRGGFVTSCWTQLPRE